MAHVTRTESIKLFLENATFPDLAALYTPDMEVQVNVAADGGEKITKEFEGHRWHGYTDGNQVWKMFRIPRNANTVPVYDDVRMSFDLSAHAEGIGMTGWDFRNLVSRWVAFDFDAITGHKERHSRKMTDIEIGDLVRKASEIPWVTIRNSAGGKGVHIYVFLDLPIATANHNEHAALARAILGKMAGITGFSFDTKVDICGQNMWVWHRKIKETDGLGLKLIKEGIPLEDVPQNWRDHVKVVNGIRKRTLPRFISQVESGEGESSADLQFLELTGQSTKIPLDASHVKLIKHLEDGRTGSWWDVDHNILVTHTWHLAAAHAELSLRGIFLTEAKGTEAPDDINCFCIPLRYGGWVVRRYSMGVQEHPTWDQDGRGWTRCYYNREPDLGTLARANEGLESPSGGFVFATAANAAETAKSLGALIPDLPPSMNTKRTILKEHSRDGRLVMEIEGDSNGVASMPGWLYEKGKWKKIFNTQAKPSPEDDGTAYDNVVRHLVTDSEEDAGWAIKSELGWRIEPLAHAKTVLQSIGIGNKEMNTVLGSSVLRAWKMVNRPFQPEFPGNREWNRGAAQLRFIPSQNVDDLKYPTWLKILKHCGAGLTSAIQSHPWAIANGIETGADYLKIWLSSLLKHPTEPLPYLFFYGPQNTGKSMFHEAIALLLTKGYVRADNALTSQAGFSGELRNAIVCVVEEINLRKSKDALNRIKDWVTARELSIHPKGQTPFHAINTTHWIQCSNQSDACPVFPGDTRITMIKIDALDPIDLIPKREMIPLLEQEAPDFLAALLSVEIPPSNDRLNVPVVQTGEKAEAERMNRNPLETFIGDHAFKTPGAMVTVSDFYDKFMAWAEPNDLLYWTKRRVSLEFPMEFPRGRNPATCHHSIGNISFEQQTGPVQPKLVSWVNEKGTTFLIPEDRLDPTGKRIPTLKPTSMSNDDTDA